MPRDGGGAGGELHDGVAVERRAALRIEGPQHKVTIARPFAVGRFEVTFAEWDACVADGGCSGTAPDHGWGRGKQPVIDVSWDDFTKEYLPWLSRKTGKTYRLLTEAEWEYAARAGTTTPFWWGSAISPKQANYKGGEYSPKPVPVDSFAKNPWGLYERARQRVGVGAGLLERQLQRCANGRFGRTTGDCSRRVARGGGWDNAPWILRSAVRNWMYSYVLGQVFGFRVGRTL